MEEKEIKNFTVFHTLIEGLYNENFLFRGQSDFSWELLPKVGRKEFQKLKPKDERILLEAWASVLIFKKAN